MRLPLALAALAVLTVGTACSDDDGGDASPASEGGSGADAATGTIAVRLEETEGIFVEGFEVGIRFETPDGEVLDSYLWSAFVEGQGAADSPDAYYDSVLTHDAPAGPVVVLAKVTIGIGPGPEPIDPTGELPCRLEVEVPDGRQVDVEVAFDPEGDCLRLAE